MAHILLVEDEEKVASFITNGLSEHNHQVDVMNDGFAGLNAAISNKYDLIILDVMLPIINGIELCKQIREHKLRIPVLMLSALGSVDDKVNGLKAGADDYLLKPFHFSELLARIDALLRRQQLVQAADEHVLSFEDLKLNT